MSRQSFGAWVVVVRVAAVGVAVNGLWGCDSSTGASSVPSASARVDRRVPVDSTEEGELAEGDQDAFGLPLPRAMLVQARFPDAVHAKGQVSFEALANYVRKRVDATRVDTGPSKTVFDGAALKKNPAQYLRVDVLSRGGLVRLVVRNLSPPARPKDPSLTDAERWKRMGLTPQGKVLPELNE